MTDFITLQEGKDWLGVTDSSKDALIQDLITSMTSTIKNWCEVEFVLTPITGELHDARRQDIIVPKNWPLASVQQLVINVATDGSGGSVIAADSYSFDDGGITLRYMVLPLQRSYLRIDYTHGFNGVPPEVKLATKIAVEGYFRMRARQSVGITSKSKEGESINYKAAWDGESGLPKEVTSLLKKYRMIEFPGGNEMATRNW